MRSFLLTFAASALMFGAASTRIAAQEPAQSPGATSESKYSRQQETRSSQTEESTSTAALSQSASGKITAVSGDTFAIEVGGGDSKETMQFVTDSNTAKSGDLKVGSEATVQYQSGSNGEKTATKVDIQG